MTNRTQRTTPGSRLLLLGLLSGVLASCGGGTEPPPPPPPPPPVEQAGLILGQITPWKAGDATSVTPKEPPISAPVTPTGQFDLALPNHAAMTTTYAVNLMSVREAFGCEANEVEGLTAPDGLKLRPITKLYTNKEQQLFSEIDPKNPNTNYLGWWFSTADATIKIKANCLVTGKIDTSLTLKKGWNVLAIESAALQYSKYAVQALPTTRTKWVYAGANALSQQALALNILEPWKNLKSYQNR